jgi:hypothetical protein
MILPSFNIANRVNKCMLTSGMDSLQYCKDVNHYTSFPHEIIYQYNSRGFRDTEWPESFDDLQNAIWCVGDSFTVGIGNPLSDTWVNILQRTTNRRCINISLEGASNAWIARKTIEVINTINPENIIIHWSYLSRGESEDTSLSDEDRRIPIAYVEDKDMIDNFLNLVTTTRHPSVIQSVIPKYTPDYAALWPPVRGVDWPESPPISLYEFNNLPPSILNELESFKLKATIKEFAKLSEGIGSIPKFIKEFPILDYGRDKHHYGRLTATYFVNQLLEFI